MIKIVDRVKGFIFDLDGVITDTAEFHFQSWKRLAEEEGIPFSREDNEKFRGVSRRRCLELLLGQREVSDSAREEMLQRKNGYYQELISQINEDNFLPGVKNILGELKEKGYKVAVASASKNAKPVIKNLGYLDFFELIADGYSVEKSKPAPDLFLYTAREMGLEPEECIVFEDAAAGIEAALAAGMVAVGIGPEERVGKAHYRYDRMADVKLKEILSDRICK